MRITIDTDVLKKYKLSLGQFIVLLTSYYNLDYRNLYEELVKQGYVERDLFKEFPPIVSNNTKDLIAKIIVESDERLRHCGIEDFETLAKTLQEIYPDGIKAGKNYPWRGDIATIAQNLRTLVAKYNFFFTEEEAIAATKEYVSSFQHPYIYMHTLRNFILYTKKENGEYTIESQFMTIIENNRENENNN